MKLSLEETAIREQWATAIGRLIVTFSECEWVTYKIIDIYGAPVDKGLNLRKRLAAIRRLLREMKLDPKLMMKTEAAFHEMALLAEARNLVAHNGPVEYFDIDKRTGSIVLQRKIVGATKADTEVTLDDLPDLLRKTVALKDRLSELLFYIQFPENRGIESTS